MRKRRMKKNTIYIIVLMILLIAGMIILNYSSTNDLNEKKDNNHYEEGKSEKNEVKTAKLTLVGDFLFEQPFYDSITNGDDKNNYFKNVKSYFDNDDLSIGNMEVVIGNDDLKSSGTGFNFCAPEYIGDLVNTLDLEVLSTANNHTFDRNKEGIDSTINYFKNKTDIMTVGTHAINSSNEDLAKLNILEINGIKFGFLAYTYGTNIKVPTELRKYVGLFKDPDTGTMTNEYKEKITNEVNTLRKEVDVLVVIMHWGIEFTHTPNSEQKNMAELLNSLGVDIIMGSHSHSIEPIEWIGDKHKTLVYYSMGNFVSADDDVSRAGEDFDNAYQVGLLSTLNITKNNNDISISDVKTEPIINYYDKNLRNFELIPLKMYTSEFETTHYRYKYNFNKSFIQNMYNKVISKEFR